MKRARYHSSTLDIDSLDAGDDDIGKLMHDFSCNDAEDIASRVRHN